MNETVDEAGQIIFDALLEKAKQQGVRLKMEWQGARWEEIAPKIQDQCVHAALALTAWLLERPDVWAAFETRKLESVPPADSEATSSYDQAGSRLVRRIISEQHNG